MLAYLSGTIQAKEMSSGPADQVVIDVHGIGFTVNVSRRTAIALGEIGQSVKINTAFVVRETDWTIFGFANAQEKKIFELLQSVSGIGPKTALSIVGTLGVHDLIDAINNDDNKMISQSPGVGNKVAQRVILELKSKMKDVMAEIGILEKSDGGNYKSSKSEVQDVLQGLGYTGTEISLALGKAKEEAIEDDVELLVRFCLKTLGTTTTV